MTFLHPALLWALPFGLMPIVIYFLMRYRSLRVTWGANYVLERALRRLRKRMNIEQVLLILARTLAAVFLVAAFARPAARGRRAAVSAASGIHHVVLLDGSYSMLAGEAGRTRWDRSKELMKALAESWGPGERWSLCRMAGEPEWIVDGRAMGSAADAAAVIDGLAVREAPVAWERGFAAVRQKLAGQAFDLYLFADDQALSWAGVDAAAANLGAPVSACWICPPLARRPNLAVTGVGLAGDLCLAGHAARAFIRVRNCGEETVADVPLELMLDGAIQAREAVSLQPRQERAVALDLAIGSAGSHHVSARLAADALDYDNRLSAGVEAVERLSVLVLRDAERAGKFESAWDFLQIAGRVEAAQDDEGSPLFAGAPVVFSLAEGEVTADALAGADAVLLDGGRKLTPALASLLKEYVLAGGALVLAADGNVAAGAWNALFGNNGLLPATLGARRAEPIGGDAFQTLVPSRLDAGPLRAFGTGEDGDLSGARFYAWHELGKPASGSRVVAAFASGQPYAVETRFEPGSVTLLAAGVSGSADNLVVREFYLPFLFRLFAGASAGARYPRTVACGEPIRWRVPDPARVSRVTFQDTDGASVPVPTQKRRQETVAVLSAGAVRSGLCSFVAVRGDAVERVWFGVQGERLDSDLTPLPEARRRELAERLGLIEVADRDALAEVLRRGATGEEWHPWVCAVLIALLAAEMILQRRFV